MENDGILSIRLDNWKAVKLKEVCSKIFSGGTPNTNKREYWNGNLPWLSSGETNNRFIRRTKSSISEDGVENSSTRLAHARSTVIASAGQGHTRGQASYLLIDTYINQSIIALFPRENLLDSRFLFYSLTPKYDRFRQISDDHSIRGSLTTRILAEEYIQMPPLKEQKAISKILSDLDSKIELNQQMNKTLESIAQAIFKHWFIDFEFPDENGQPYKSSGGEMVDSELGEIPKGWRVGRIEELTNVSSGKRPLERSETRTELFSVELIGASSVMGYTKEPLINEKVIVIGRVGTHGVVQRTFGPSWPSDNTLIFSSTNTEYIFQCLKRIDYESLNVGSTQPLITQTQLKKYQIIIPCKDILEKFETTASILYTKVFTNKLELENLRVILDLLLHKLMSGKIRVPLEE